jgi:hypothetical protein
MPNYNRGKNRFVLYRLKRRLRRNLAYTAEMVYRSDPPSPEDIFARNVKTIAAWIALQRNNFCDRLKDKGMDGLALFDPFWKLYAKHGIHLTDDQKKTLFVNFMRYHGIPLEP